MLDKRFDRPLTIRFNNQQLSFSALAEFEFALAGRTEVPASQLGALFARGPEALEHEAGAIKAVEKQLVAILTHAIETQAGVGAHLRSIDPQVFSQDHGWREIMLALRSQDDGYEALRRVALVKYMQYLAARQEVIKHIYAVKKLQRPAGTGLDRGASIARAAEPARERPPQPLPDEPPAAMRETVILDTLVIEPAGRKKEHFARLPKGEPVIVPTEPDASIDLLLSKHAFKLDPVLGGMQFVDDTGARHLLHPGKNIIGRDAVCNIVVDAAYHDVSRLHLVIEQLGMRAARLTDLSAHGTFVPAGLLGDRNAKP